MRIIEDQKLDFNNVLIVPKRSTLTSRASVNLTRTFKMKHTNREWSGIPIIAANMYATGSTEMAQAFNEFEMSVALHKYYTPEELREFFDKSTNDVNNLRKQYNFVSIGMSEKELANIALYNSTDQINICIDVANGYSTAFGDWVKFVRHSFPYSIIMAGNVVTPEMTAQLILDGADIVKVGLGSGSRCQTRKVTGVGYPQFSSIIDCADAAHGLGGLICSDGGIREVGDFCKAFCAGADFVMSGGFFAGVDECLGEWIYNKYWSYAKPECLFSEGIPIGHTIKGSTVLATADKSKDGQRVDGALKISLKFFGMSSYEAMEQFGGKEKEYRASEGTCEYIPYKGPAKDTIKEILGGLRSCGTYIGAARLKDFSKCATFIKL